MNTTIVVFSTAVPAIIAGCESQTMKRTKLLALSVCCLAVLRTLGASAASDDAATALASGVSGGMVTGGLARRNA